MGTNQDGKGITKIAVFIEKIDKYGNYNLLVKIQSAVVDKSRYTDWIQFGDRCSTI